jgi:hypothetical protein
MKLVTITGAQFKFLATCPWSSSYGGSLTGYPYAAIINGYYALIYAGQNGNADMGVAVYLFDTKGNICTFKTYGWSNNVTSLSMQVFQVGNVFTIVFQSGNTYTLTLPNVFVAGSTFYLSMQKRTVPNGPCGIGTGYYQRTIFLQDQELTAYEYVQAFPDADNTWASVYNKNGQLVGGGYIGNYPSNVDPFYKFSQSLPQYVSADYVMYKNGSFVYINGNSVGYPFQVIGWNSPRLYGDPSQLICGVGNPNVYIAANGPGVSQNISAIQGASFWPDPHITAAGVTDLPGFYCVPAISLWNGTFKIGLVSGDWLAYVDTGSGSSPCSAAYLQSQNKLYNLLEYRPGGLSKRTGDIYISDFNATQNGLAPQPVVTQTAHKGLINWHRPISVNGEYLT